MAFRNFVVHEYFGLDWEIVWQTATDSVPDLSRQVSAILTAAGSGLKKVVRTTVFLNNMGDFAAMNEVYGRFFNVTPPSRSTVEVARLPKDVLVEIDVIALA